MLRREPLWAVALTGWLAVPWAWEAFSADRGARGTGLATSRPVGPKPGASAAAPDPERASARELRRLPGIGETRALEIVRDRWQRAATGEPLDWRSIPGIGPLTERRIREALTREPAPAPERADRTRTRLVDFPLHPRSPPHRDLQRP